MSPDENERLQILEMVAAGQITAEEAVRLIETLHTPAEATPETLEGDEPPEIVAAPMEDQPAAGESQAAGADEAASPPLQSLPKLRQWRNWWQIPLWFGVAITVMGAILMYLAWQAQQFSFLFICSWLPFLIGVGVITLAWASRTARWLHVRIRQKPGERPPNIAISFPIPLRPAAWVLRLFRGRISGLEGANLDEMFQALAALSPDTPLYVEVDDNEDGEKVEVYIG